jgi:hypothetical protein
MGMSGFVEDLAIIPRKEGAAWADREAAGMAVIMDGERRKQRSRAVSPWT